MNFKHLPPQVAAQLRAFYRRKRILGLLRALATTAAVYGLLVLVAVHIDRFWLLSQADRVVITGAVHAVTALLAVVLTVWWYSRSGTATALAYELEKRLDSDVHERIVTLHALTESPDPAAQNSAVHDALMAHLRASTEDIASSLNAGGRARDAKLGRRLAAVVAVVVVHSLFLLPTSYQYPLMVKRFLNPQADLAKPSFVQISIEPAELTLGVGGEAVIQAETTGRMPKPVAWIMEALGTATAQCEIAVEPLGDSELVFSVDNTEAMTRIQRTLYLHTRSDVQESFRFRVRHGDAVTQTYTVRVVQQPVVSEIALHVVPPAYSKLPEQDIVNPTAPIGLLAGSAVTMRFRVDQPTRLQELRAEGRDEPLAFTWDAETRTGEYSFEVASPLSLQVHVENTDGFANVTKASVDIAVREDEPPSVRLESPTADLSLVPGELIPMRLAIEDDLGLAEAAIRYQLNPSRNPDASFQEEMLDLGEAPERRLSLNPSFDLSTTGATPGDEVLVMIRVRDSAGNDGQTRPLLIRVVAFTRGENERRRLAVLGFLQAALRVAATLPEDPEKAAAAPTGLALSTDNWTAILALGETAHVELPETGSLETLLELLERELHFTDRPRHKTDLRYLYGRILATALRAKTATERAADLRAVADEHLPPLTESRRLVNLYTRVFGLQAEAADIQHKLQELDTAGENADEDTERAVKRRATLYLDVLQDLGEELITLAEEQEGLDAEAILEMQGEMNSQAYRMKRGSVSKRLDGAAAVLVELQKLTALLAPPVPGLMAREIATRQALAEQNEASYQQVIRGELPIRWLRDDGRLLDFDPFVTQAERGRNLAILQALATSTDVPQIAKTVPAAAEAQRRRMAGLAHAWELQYFVTGTAVSAAERRLIRWTLHLTQSWWQTAPTAAEIAATTEAFKAAMVAPDATVELWQTEPAAAVDGLLATTSFESLTAELMASLTAATTAQDALAAAMQSQDEEVDVAGAIRALHDTSVTVETKLALASDLSSYGYRFLPDPSTDATLAEYNILGLRAAQMRYQQRSLPVIASLADARTKELNAGALAQLQGDLAQLAVARTALASVLAKLLAEPPTPEDAIQRYPALADYRATRQRLVLSEAARQGKPDVAAAYIAAFPAAGLAYLATKTDGLQAAIADLEACRVALDQPIPDFALYTTRLTAAREQLNGLLSTAQMAGETEEVVAIREAISELSGVRLARLDASKELAEKDLRRRIYDLSETIPQAERLLRDLRAFQADRAAAGADYRGGPAGIWEDANHADADVARRRLGHQTLMAEDIVTEQILASLEASAPASAETVDWAVFLHRLARSPLAGPVRTQPKRVDRTAGGDKFVDWLQKELAESRKAVQNRANPETYDPITLEYLDSLKDFLRY